MPFSDWLDFKLHKLKIVLFLFYLSLVAFDYLHLALFFFWWHMTFELEICEIVKCNAKVSARWLTDDDANV